MNKSVFLSMLREKLSGLPEEDRNERLAFFSESIDDRVEEGLSEEEAVAALGTVEEIATQVIADTPLVTIVRKKLTPKKRLRGWEILLLVLGSPVWLSLGVALAAVALSLYATLFAVIVSLWAVFVSLLGGALGGVLGGATVALSQEMLPGLALVGAGVLAAGLSVFVFFGCKAATRGICALTKTIGFKTKRSLTRKGEA
ncbi:MAG: DUF1700 domain-containing protein [Clostridia bacterium]|nr:DUF1700 domain-containing protein [Clostridia bacterium]